MIDVRRILGGWDPPFIPFTFKSEIELRLPWEFAVLSDSGVGMLIIEVEDDECNGCIVVETEKVRFCVFINGDELKGVEGGTGAFLCTINYQ